MLGRGLSPGPLGLWCAGEWRYMDSTQAWIPCGYLAFLEASLCRDNEEG